jgi:hypothetical protein
VVQATHQQKTKRFDNIPGLEGGWVEVRRLSHGERLDRLDESMHFEGGGDGDTKVFVSTAKSRLFDFKHCIIDHNLEDADGRKLNLADPKDVRNLAGPVGDAIAEIINEHNQALEEASGDVIPN